MSYPIRLLLLAAVLARVAFLAAAAGEVAGEPAGSPEEAVALHPGSVDSWFEDLATRLDPVELGGPWIDRPWDLVTHNAAQLERDFEAAGRRGISNHHLATAAVVGPARKCRLAPSRERVTTVTRGQGLDGPELSIAKLFLKLSTPLDLLRFKPLKFVDRVRLGLLALRARRVENWMTLENRTAADWLRQLGGNEVYRVVWEPLLRGKFGAVADEISAVWFWNKLKLRGGSRGKGGKEQLAYYRGGFAALADTVAGSIRSAGGEVKTGMTVTGLTVENGQVTGVMTPDGNIAARAVILTPPLPIAADLLAPHVPADYEARLRRIRYLANVCIVLELDRSLSDTYWLNVNDPGFPFVGVIEHTNFEPASTYHGRHIVYLSKYLPETDELYGMSDSDVVDFTLKHLSRMFPTLSRKSVLAAHVWRAQYSQPIVERGYSALIPSTETPVGGLYLTSMAQIYPEDRGTNYAIQQGRAIGAQIADEMLNKLPSARVVNSPAG